MASLKPKKDSVQQFDLRGVTSFDQLLEKVSTFYGKPIHLEALGEDAWGPLTAFLDETPEEVTVFYRTQDSPQYQLQCICHEFGHLVLGTGCGLSIDESVASQVEIGDRSIRVQARDLRDTAEERAAEEFAFAVIRHLRNAGREKSLAAVIWA